MSHEELGDPTLHVRLSYLTSAVDDLKRNVSDVNETLKTLIRVEERQLSQAAHIDDLRKTSVDHEERLQKVEHDVPPLREMRSWVVAAVLVLCIAGAAALASGWIQLKGPVEVVRTK